jgi:methylphosphotriester-DNA--protein-cysteine methyltransferase
MSFGQWRRQFHVITAVRRLTAGDSVQTVAIDLGYESASSFVTMFKKVLGKPPIRYLRSVNTGTERGFAASKMDQPRSTAAAQ